MLENCNRVIEYCSAKGVEFVNVGANDFVDGNERIILGFLWKVILRFVVSEDGQQGLLLWCQRSTKPYDNIKIKNFHRSWNDGLGFVGVIHKYRPDLIADPSTLDPEMPRTTASWPFLSRRRSSASRACSTSRMSRATSSPTTSRLQRT